jgi:oligopeptide/dipeptide ABC transporter ATP-binding protein
MTALLQARDVRRTFTRGGLFGRTHLRAVDGVDLDVRQGEVLALVGESGCGKTTLGRLLLGLDSPDAGSIELDGRALSGLDRRTARRRLQPVFQDPYASLDPRWPVARTVREALDAQRVGTREQRRARVVELLAAVGLEPRLADSLPHELSGGQRQRVAIAAALAAEPDVLVADEPVSALDLLVQAQILNLLATLREQRNLAIVLITHDLTVVEHIADRVAVMYLGKIVELGTVEAVTRTPAHPYTRALLAAAPRLRTERNTTPPLRGELPSPLHPPPGCHFNPRCPLAIERCLHESPELASAPDGQLAACHVTAPAFTESKESA